jgi:ribose transport system substrate-binding protein
VFIFGIVTGAIAQEYEELPVPNERYLIAFSNGEMSNEWRWAFVDSMQEWANKFRKLGPGIEYVWTNAGNDSAKQLMDVENLLAMNPSVLIVSPNQDEPLDPIIDMASDAGVPLMVIDRSLVRKPGIGTYFTNITQNYAMSGAYQAVYALEWLKEKYGEYRGSIVEIQGIIGSSPTTDEYVGIRAILQHSLMLK